MLFLKIIMASFLSYVLSTKLECKRIQYNMRLRLLFYLHCTVEGHLLHVEAILLQEKIFYMLHIGNVSHETNISIHTWLNSISSSLMSVSHLGINTTCRELMVISKTKKVFIITFNAPHK